MLDTLADWATDMDKEDYRDSCRHGAVLKAEDVWFRYEDRYVLRNVSLDIDQGEIVIVMGPNGAGKSTLLKIFSGILRPEKGDVYVCGYNTKNVSEGFLAKFIGYIHQNPWFHIFNPKVIDEITFTARNLGMDIQHIEKNVLDIATRLDIVDLLDRSPFTLSEGEVRRVVIASALVHNPAALLLDEPTAGLDYILKKNFIDMIKRINNHYRTTVVISTHDLDLLTLIPNSRLIVLANGEIIYDGSVREAIEFAEDLYRYGLGVPAEIELSKRLGIDFEELQTFVDILLYMDKLRDVICH